MNRQDQAGAALRASAARIVDQVVRSGRSLDTALPEHESGVDDADRALLRLLCYGTIRRHFRISEWIDTLLDRPLKRCGRLVASLIAVGLFQLTETRIPPHAAVAATVDAARALRRPALAGLVNAVLRRFQREALADAEPGSEEARFDHPRWLIETLKRDWPQDWQSILDANNQRAPMWLRVNVQRSSVADYLDALVVAEIDAEVQPDLSQAVRLGAPRAVSSLPGFAEGQVSVQDAAAQLAAPWLLHEIGGRPPLGVLDACAAPGGKSAHLKELGGDSIDLTCIEIDEERAAAIGDNLARLGLQANIRVDDAASPAADDSGFEAILLDVPCSATGVIRRHPDIKLLRRSGDIPVLAATQRKLLEALWQQLTPGGRLLYVTCSVIAAENDEVVRTFVDKTPGAEEIDVLHNNNIRDLMRRKACGYQILPGTAGMDGFYFACLSKTS